MIPSPDEDKSSLENARERLYRPQGVPRRSRETLASPGERNLPHAWKTSEGKLAPLGPRHVRLASVFFTIAVAFFFIALLVAGYFFYFGANEVSVDKVAIAVQGPTAIAGGDTVPLSFTVTNTNPVAIDNATIEVDFPNGTRDATNVLAAYPRYTEDLGTIASGASVTRSTKAILFGAAGQSLALPVTLSYGTTGSNATFVKKSSYSLAISSTPLSVSVDTLTETVANKPLTLTVTIRSNASVPLTNVVLEATLPFGFVTTASSLPFNNSTFAIGTLAPGATKTVTLTGTLSGQNNEQRVFRFTVGTADAANTQSLAVNYMTQDATVTIAAPFIDATVALNGDTSNNAVITPGSVQSVTVTYNNTLTTTVANATVAIALSGAAIDYASVRTTSGFYSSGTRTVIFSKDTDPALAALAPGASGIGAFTFSTLPAGAGSGSPSANLTISVSGTRLGQSNVPELVNATLSKSYKVATAVALAASSLHSSGPFTNGGPIPPRAGATTGYTITWNAQNRGSTVAGAAVTATLPSYVTYTGATSGAGSFTYDEKARVVTWSVGDIAQGASAQGAFQVSIVPSTTQKGTTPQLTGPASFTGYDRFAGVQVSATANPVTTETPGDPGYTPTAGAVQ